jgi:hypothetical protein
MAIISGQEGSTGGADRERSVEAERQMATNLMTAVDWIAPPARPAAVGWAAGLRARLSAARTLLQHRAVARELRSRPDWMLRDIGLDYADIDRAVHLGR